MRNYEEEIRELLSETNNLSLAKSETGDLIKESFTKTRGKHKERQLTNSERSGWSNNPNRRLGKSYDKWQI